MCSAGGVVSFITSGWGSPPEDLSSLLLLFNHPPANVNIITDVQ